MPMFVGNRLISWFVSIFRWLVSMHEYKRWLLGCDGGILPTMPVYEEILNGLS